MMIIIIIIGMSDKVLCLHVCINKFTDKNRFLLVFTCHSPSYFSQICFLSFCSMLGSVCFNVSMRALESECECVFVTVRESEFPASRLISTISNLIGSLWKIE